MFKLLLLFFAVLDVAIIPFFFWDLVDIAILFVFLQILNLLFKSFPVARNSQRTLIDIKLVLEQGIGKFLFIFRRFFDRSLYVHF